MATTDVLIIGGGLMGCATAYELSRRGLSVTLVERREEPGRETTARSGAIIRAHYGVPELVSLALEANRRYVSGGEDGLDFGFQQCGYAVLVDEDDRDVLLANMAMHRDLGVDVSLLQAHELQDMVPALKTHDVSAVAYEPKGGYADPLQTVKVYADAARRKGTTLCFGATVIGAQKFGDEWRIELQNGDTISAAQVVLCTGNWSQGVGALLGLKLPVAPVRAQITVMQRPPQWQGSFPVISDLVNLAYFRVEGESGMWVGSSDMSDLQEQLPAPEGFNEAADEAAIEAARHKTALRFEGFDTKNNGDVQRAFCGLYETTPDWQPIIDSFENVHVAVGFSGHGFKLAPVVGEEMAHRVASTRSPFDASIFDLARFEEGRHIKSRHVYRRARFLR
jgi:glycine/D-amino acid oxidase-like deaminating enzyme